MLKNALRTLPVVAVLVALVASLIPAGFALANDTSITVVAQYQDDVTVVRDSAATSELPSLDPQVATDSVSIAVIENLFHGLTNYDPITSQVAPELATDWAPSEDGLSWTFTLRNDVMWYRYDPASGTAAELRPVVAADVVYGIKRACDPRIGSYYGSIASTVIAGCNDVYATSADETTDDLVFGDTTQVSAPDDTTVVINLQFAAGYFFSMTPMWMLRPVHQETIEEFGDEWTVPGNIATNGEFFIQENTRGVRRTFVRNENHPADLSFGGNIDQINFTVIEDLGTIFALYQDNQLDSSAVPTAELQAVLENPDYADELSFTTTLTVYYFGFGHDKPPFDNVHARRAFSSIIDREAFIQQVVQGRGLPMIHFTPPGMAHAAPINEVGVGFDPDFAKTELEAAGYPNCEGFPNVNFAAYQGAGAWVEFWSAAAEEYLGCSPDLFTVEQLEFSVLLQVTDSSTPTEDRPNVWTLGWGPDYGDANNWVHDVLSCEVDYSFMRPCTATDDLINAASRESDPAARDQMYREIEEAFFGAEGEFPIAPIYMNLSYALNKTWYTGPFDTDGLFGGAHWGAYTIDMAAKNAARGE